MSDGGFSYQISNIGRDSGDTRAYQAFISDTIYNERLITKSWFSVSGDLGGTQGTSSRLEEDRRTRQFKGRSRGARGARRTRGGDRRAQGMKGR